MAEPTASEGRHGLHELRDDGEIDACLRRLCRYHSLLSLRRSGDARAQPSAVLSVQRAHGRLLLDAIPDVFGVDTPLHVNTRFDGAELVFTVRTIGTTMFDGEPALMVTLPTSIRRRDRRASRRLPVHANTELPHSHARLDDAAPAQVSFDFEIVDISAAGVGAQANAVPSALLVGDRLELRLELPGRSLPVTATLRTQAKQSDGGVRVGLAFTDLHPRQADQLAAVLLQIERQQLRNAFGSHVLF